MTLYDERMKMREDLLAGRVPKRVPMVVKFTLEAACGYAGVDLVKAHYDPALAEKAYTRICEDFYSDTFPNFNIRFPAPFQILGARNWALGSNGAVQHPEVELLAPGEYDEFIEDPYKMIMEKLLQRACPPLEADPATSRMILAEGYSTFKQQIGAQGAVIKRLSERFGYMPAFNTGAGFDAPFDFVADHFRGFKGIVMDIRRMPEKVAAAVQAVYPLMWRLATPARMKPGDISFIPLHMAPYINNKTFAAMFWPTLEKLVMELDALGVMSCIFAEGDLTRYHEFLASLPKSTSFQFEDGNYKLIKDTVGKNHVIGGFFDPSITLARSKEACIDEAKRLVETCAPGGRFYFCFSKNVMDIKSIDVSKLQAVLDWVHTRTNY